MSHHLGCDFGRDNDRTLHLCPRKNTEKMIYCHVKMFGSKSKLNVMSPLEKGDHPELGTTKHLDQDGMQKC